MTATRQRLLLVLWSITLFSLCMALNTRHQGFPYYYHPDEPGKVEQILTGTWNLHHPPLLLESTKLYMKVAGTPRNEQAVVEAGRTVSAIFISAAVVLFSLLAYLWRGWGTGITAGLVLAWHHQLYELSHYFKEDSALLFGVALTCIASWLHAARPTIPRAVCLGAACALAISGKYLGVLVLVLALPVVLANGTARLRNFAVFGAALLLALALVNLPVFTNFETFQASFARETDLVVQGQGGMSRKTPHAQYWSIFLDNTTPVMWALLLVYIAARGRHRHPATMTEIMLSVFPFIFAIALSFSPKSNDRYFLPATAMFAVVATIGAGALADWVAPRHPRRLIFSLAALALIAAQFPNWTSSRQGWLGYDRAFQRDDNQELIAWLNAMVPPEAVIAKDNRIALPDPKRKKHAARLGVVPQKVLAKRFAADFSKSGAVDELRAQGITHVAVSESDYGKFFLRSLRPQEKEIADFERRRAFYDELFRDGELLFERERGTVIYLHPGIRVYRLR